MSGMIAYCRPGFENDMAAELDHKANELGAFGYSSPKPGFVHYHCLEPDHTQMLEERLSLESLLFARQRFALLAELALEDPQDRIGPVLALLAERMQGTVFGEVRVESPDTTEGRELATFCRKFAVPLRQHLRKQGWLTAKESARKPVLFVFFVDSMHAYLGYSHSQRCSPHPLGILRLKMPADAPSRSTLKLDEAFLTLAPDMDPRLHGQQAVDLGACPGGWTYQLVRRGMFVTAIDNGSIDTALMDSGQVIHLAVDGFKYRPKKKNVQLLVCDMIEKPDRVALLMADWIIQGDAEAAIFNLKLPMKRRYAMVQECLDLINQRFMRQGMEMKIKGRHLYHNREEVTFYLTASQSRHR